MQFPCYRRGTNCPEKRLFKRVNCPTSGPQGKHTTLVAHVNNQCMAIRRESLWKSCTRTMNDLSLTMVEFEKTALPGEGWKPCPWCSECKVTNLKVPCHINVVFWTENTEYLRGLFSFFLDNIGKFFVCICASLLYCLLCVPLFEYAVLFFFKGFVCD